MPQAVLLIAVLGLPPVEPPPSTPPVYRLLIQGVLHQSGGGYRVTSITAGSPTLLMNRVDNPAVLMGLEVGDVILRVNGQPIPTAASLGQLVQAAGGRSITLTILDHRTNTTADWRVTPVRSAGPAPTPTTGGVKVHAVLVGDTLDKDIGKGCAADIASIKSLLTAHVHSSRVGTVTVLVGQQASADGVLKAVAALPSRPQDTLLVYVTSHGAFDPAVADPLSGGHFLALRHRGGKDLPRVAVRKSLADRPGRTKLLVTDACNTLLKIVRPPVTMAPGAPAPGSTPPKEVSAVEKLFFSYVGRLDVNAASPGETATGMDVEGGLFTLALTAAMTRPGNWTTVLKETSTEAKRALRGSPQTAKVFENSLRPADPPGGLPPLLEPVGRRSLPSWWGQ